MRTVKVLSATMRLSGGSAIVSRGTAIVAGAAAVALLGYLLYRKARSAEQRASAAEASVDDLRNQLN